MNESGVIYTATDATKVTTPEPGMLRQVLAYNPHLMLVRHTFEKGWKGARHSHPHHQMVYVVRGHILFRPGQKLGDARRRQHRCRWRSGAPGFGLRSVRSARHLHPLSAGLRVAGSGSRVILYCRAGNSIGGFLNADEDALDGDSGCCLAPARYVAMSQPPAPGDGIIGIAHIAFRVSDLDREIAFLGKLGYEEAFAMTNGGRTTEVFIKINDREFIELYPQTSPSQPIGWMHVCYEVGDLNVLYKFYTSMGLNLSPVQKAAAGNLISHVDDPEHRVTEFTQYMPGSRHTLDRGQHLGMGRISTELLGFDLPVTDGAAMKEFYTDLGFEPEDVNGNVRLTAPGAPDMHIELRACACRRSTGVSLRGTRRAQSRRRIEACRHQASHR